MAVSMKKKSTLKSDFNLQGCFKHVPNCSNITCDINRFLTKYREAE